MKFLTLFLILLGGGLSFGASNHTIGNGGDVVICKKSYASMNFQKVMLLDHYEARSKWKLTLNFPQTGDVTQRAAEMVKRIQIFHNSATKTLLKSLDTFWESTLLENNLYLPGLPDEGAVLLPGPDCRLEQVAMSLPQNFATDPIFYIKKEIWDQMTTDDQVMLVLHEVVFLNASQSPSAYIRRYVAALAQQNYGPVDRLDFLSNFSGLYLVLESFEPHVWKSYLLHPGQFLFDSNGEIREAIHASKSWPDFTWGVSRVWIQASKHHAGRLTEYTATITDRKAIRLRKGCEVEVQHPGWQESVYAYIKLNKQNEVTAFSVWGDTDLKLKANQNCAELIPTELTTSFVSEKKNWKLNAFEVKYKP